MRRGGRRARIFFSPLASSGGAGARAVRPQRPRSIRFFCFLFLHAALSQSARLGNRMANFANDFIDLIALKLKPLGQYDYPLPVSLGALLLLGAVYGVGYSSALGFPLSLIHI